MKSIRIKIAIIVVLTAVFIIGANLLYCMKLAREWADFSHDIKISNYQINGYIEENGVLINQVGDAQIQFPQIDQYVDCLAISFDQPLEKEMSVAVYYAEATHGYSEDYNSAVIAEAGATLLYVPIQKEITTCRVDIGTTVGEQFNLGEMILNPSEKRLGMQPERIATIVLVTVLILAVLGGTSPKFLRYLDSRPDEMKLSHSEWLYLVFCFAIYFIWSVTFVSMSYGPDEYMRYDIPKFIFENGALPYGWEESIRNPLYGFSYGFDISLPYLTSALFMWLTSLFTASSEALLIAARFTSVLSTVGATYYAILISKKLFKDNPLRWIFVLFISLIPQVVFLSSYVNLDTFSLFTVMLIIYAWICGLEREWDKKSCIRLAIGIGLCFLSYKFVYSFILVSFLMYCFWYWLNRRKVSFRKFFCNGLFIVLIVFLICGWKFIRNGIIYDGDFLSLSASRPYAELYAVDWLKPAAKTAATYRYKGLSILGMLKESVWLEATYKSFFSNLGYMDVPAERWVYRGYFLTVLTGISGIVLFFIQGWGGHTSPEEKGVQTCDGKILISSILAASAITIFISLYFSWAVGFQPQGRYIIGSLPFVSFVVTFGINTWIETIFGDKIHCFTKKCIVGMIGAFVLVTMLEGYMNCLMAFIY